MNTEITIAACQLPEIRENIDDAMCWIEKYAERAGFEGASLVCFPECFLQGYLTDETSARRNALDLASPAFEAVLNRLPKNGPMVVMGLIEMEAGRLYRRLARNAGVGRFQSRFMSALKCIPAYKCRSCKSAQQCSGGTSASTNRRMEAHRLRQRWRQKARGWLFGKPVSTDWIGLMSS